MRALLVAFVVLSAGIALWQYTSPVNFIAQLMGISWGALAGAFLGPFLWGLYSGRVFRAAVWASFVVGEYETCCVTVNWMAKKRIHGSKTKAFG